LLLTLTINYPLSKRLKHKLSAFLLIRNLAKKYFLLHQYIVKKPSILKLTTLSIDTDANVAGVESFDSSCFKGFYKKMELIHWADLPGNKYLKKLQPTMLQNRCVVRQKIRQVGIKRSEAPKDVGVFYDRDYVVTRLLIDVIEPLKIDSLDQLTALVTDCWNESKNTNLKYE